MKRHPALAGLSRDHHQVLTVALRLRRATEADAGDVAQAFASHWDDERRHFRLEEELLLPAYAAHGDPDDAVIASTVRDHMLIRRDVARLLGDDLQRPDLALLHELGERLEAHVRLEERQLFPLVETTLPEAELNALGERLAAAGA